MLITEVEGLEELVPQAPVYPAYGLGMYGQAETLEEMQARTKGMLDKVIKYGPWVLGGTVALVIVARMLK